MAVGKHRPDPQKSLVGFVVGDVAYAVPISSVQGDRQSAAAHRAAARAQPRSPAWPITAARSFPIVDLRVRFGLPRLRRSAARQVDPGRRQGRTVGLSVDRVTDVFGTGGAELRPRADARLRATTCAASPASRRTTAC